MAQQGNDGSSQYTAAAERTSFDGSSRPSDATGNSNDQDTIDRSAATEYCDHLTHEPTVDNSGVSLQAEGQVKFGHPVVTPKRSRVSYGSGHSLQERGEELLSEERKTFKKYHRDKYPPLRP